MTKLLLISLVAVALPIVVIVAGGLLMLEVSGANAARLRQEKLPPPLQGRWKGYTLDDTRVYLDKLDEGGLLAERRLLKFDLLFAVLYSSALAFSLLLLWNTLDAGFSPVWVLIPVVVVLMSDWIETAVLLRELNNVIAGGIDSLRPGPIAVASVATIVKLASGGASIVLLFVLAVWTNLVKVLA